MKDNVQRRVLLPDYQLLTYCFPLDESRYEIRKVKDFDVPWLFPWVSDTACEDPLVFAFVTVLVFPVETAVPE